MKFYIAVEEVRSTVVEVEAKNLDEAIYKTEEAYMEDVICLDNVMYVTDGTEFYDQTDYFESCTKDGYEPDFQKI